MFVPDPEKLGACAEKHRHAGADRSRKETVLISSLGSQGERVSHGIQLPVRAFSGAHCARVIGGGNCIVDEHSHDWPVLSLYVMGDCRKIFDRGEMTISGPSAVLHGSGEAHANRLGDVGLEQIDLQFDPDWLGADHRNTPLEGVSCWLGGPVAAAATQLAGLWSDPRALEPQLAEATKNFLCFALASREQSRPPWLVDVAQRLEIGRPASASDLAREVGLHPSWLAQAYRKSMGEGLRQTLQRRRLEQATRLLRSSDLPAAEVAAAAGFCDQSHMNRTFRAILDRTPAQVRAERAMLGGAAP